jgi:hypothetical protein
LRSAAEPCLGGDVLHFQSAQHPCSDRGQWCRRSCPPVAPGRREPPRLLGLYVVGRGRLPGLCVRPASPACACRVSGFRARFGWGPVKCEPWSMAAAGCLFLILLSCGITRRGCRMWRR